MFKKSVITVLFVSLPLIFSGCLLVPIINGVKEMGATKEDRARLFDKAISDFHDYQRMQMISEVAGFVDTEYKQEFLNIFRARRNTEKLVDFSIEIAEFNENVDEAIVDVAVRNFKLNRYIVETRIEKQVWYFESSAWKLKKIDIINAG